MEASWQDIVLMVGSFIISFALIPTIINKHKPAPLTSFLDGVVLAVFAGTYITLGLYLGAVAVGLCAIMWFILLAQVLVIKRRKRDAVHH